MHDFCMTVMQKSCILSCNSQIRFFRKNLSYTFFGYDHQKHFGDEKHSHHSSRFRARDEKLFPAVPNIMQIVMQTTMKMLSCKIFNTIILKSSMRRWSQIPSFLSESNLSQSYRFITARGRF